jgi:hypothetical protein
VRRLTSAGWITPLLSRRLTARSTRLAPTGASSSKFTVASTKGSSLAAAGEASELAPPGRIEARQALGEMGEGDIAELVDEPANLGTGAELPVLLAT